MNWDKSGNYSASKFLKGGDFPALGAAGETRRNAGPAVFVVDDDHFSRFGARLALEEAGLTVFDFEDCETFLAAYNPRAGSCLVLDVHFPGMGGLELLGRLQNLTPRLPTVIMSGESGISEAVQSMKSGATDFIQKPISPGVLVGAVQKALEQSRRLESALSFKEVAVDHLADLTRRQIQIMSLILEGHPSKNIAVDLGISQRTVENHRAAIMHKTGATSLPALARLVIAASSYLDETL